MSARTLSDRTSLMVLLKEILFTRSQMEVEPLATPYVPTFQAHRDKWQTVFVEEVSLIEALMRAQAAVQKADQALDRFVAKVLNTLDEHTAGPTRRAISKKLLKGRQPAKFTRRVLAGQLLDMKDWSDTLAKCGVAELAALSNEAASVWNVANQASEARRLAKAQNRDFRDVGTRKQFVDEVNASRKEIDGALAKLPFQNPALPPDYHEIFWMGEPPREEEETIQDVEAAIADLKSTLEKREAQLAQMKQEAADEAKLAKEEGQNAQRAADLRAQAKKLLEEADALQPDE